MSQTHIKTFDEAIKDTYINDMFEVNFGGLVSIMEAMKNKDTAFFVKNEPGSFLNGMIMATTVHFTSFLKDNTGITEGSSLSTKIYNKALKYIEKAILDKVSP